MKNAKAILLCAIGLLLACILGIFVGRNLPDDRASLTKKPQSPAQSDTSDTAGTTEAEETEIGMININTATKEQLILLPGIGETLAQRIIDYRTANGPFQKIEDLMNVTGIGEKRFDAIKDLITTGG